MSEKIQNAEINTSRRLTRLYIFALTALAILTFGGQVLIQQSISNQRADSRIINIAGSQRYLSQQIVKLCLLIQQDMDHPQLKKEVEELDRFVKRWKKGHKGLQYGDTELDLPGNNSEIIKQYFNELEPFFQQMVIHTLEIIELKRAIGAPDKNQINEHVKSILVNEHSFFKIMDKIVHQFDKEASEKVIFLRKAELLLFMLTLLILILEGLIIFRPAVQKIKLTIKELIESEQKAFDLATRLSKANQSLELSIKNLKDINYALDHATILAKTDKYGIITYVNDKFCEVSKYKKEELIGNRFHIVSGHYHSKAFFDHLWETISAGKIWNKEVKNKAKDGSIFWLDATIVPISGADGKPYQFIAIYTDVTARFKQSINEQKIRSASIIEGQEKERKKIARELHDGLGQMLTALKFNISALKGAPTKKEKGQLEDIKKLIFETIVEVRRISFNLMPNVLNDFGIASALKHLAEQVAKNSKIKVIFENNSNFQRLNKTVEINLYRIVQEGLNNAIKYSEADEIRIIINSTQDALELVISDNGRGFNSSDKRGSGNGIINIQERTDLINGEFTIASKSGSGTKITINIPFNKLENYEKHKSSFSR